MAVFLDTILTKFDLDWANCCILQSHASFPHSAMEAKSMFLHSKTMPFCSTFTDTQILPRAVQQTPSVQLKQTTALPSAIALNPSKPRQHCLSQNPLFLSTPTRTRTSTHLLAPFKFSYSSTSSYPESQTPLLKHSNNLSSDSLKANPI